MCQPGSFCAYLMTINTVTTGPASLLYASDLWRITGMTRQVLRRTATGTSLYVAMDGIIGGDFPATQRAPYAPFRGFDPPAGDGIQLARFDFASGAPNALRFALQTTPGRPTSGDVPVFADVHRLNDLVVLPSGATAVTSVFKQGSGASAAHFGFLDVFYKSGQLRASESSLALLRTHRLASRSGGSERTAWHGRTAAAVPALPPAAAGWDISVIRYRTRSWRQHATQRHQSGSVQLTAISPQAHSAAHRFGVRCEDLFWMSCAPQSLNSVFRGTTHVTCTTETGGLQAQAPSSTLRSRHR